VKSYPKSDVSSSFSAKLAPLYSGPYCVSRWMSEVNYCLTKEDTGEEAGIFHIANLHTPFYTWATASSDKATRQKLSANVDPGLLDRSFPPVLLDPDPGDCSIVDTRTDKTDSDHADTVLPFSAQETADIALETDSVSPPPVDGRGDVPGCYNFRPRRVPRVTADW
ncbi:hypothetical protein GOODEAATRI_020805, partial [Goodea atripinnis]